MVYQTTKFLLILYYVTSNNNSTKGALNSKTILGFDDS